MGAIRILVVDGHTLFRCGVASLLRQQADFEVVEEARDGPEAVAHAAALKPDVILMDADLPGRDALAVVQQLKALVPAVKIVLYTEVETDADLWEAMGAGADGYLPKQIAPEELCRTLRGALHGEVAISRATATTLFETLARLIRQSVAEPRPHAVLSRREQEVLELLATGARNKEMATTLGISEHTVKSHLKRIMSKLQLENRAQAVAYVFRLGKDLIPDNHRRVSREGSGQGDGQRLRVRSPIAEALAPLSL